MSRPLRPELPGAVYHLTARGNARSEIFLDDGDRSRFLEVLAATIGRRGWRCHAWCLMTSHDHLLIETPAPTLAQGMRDLNGIYTQSFNRRRGRSGHVLQGRYKAILVQRDTHLLELGRYVVLNPVRARMVRRPSDWPWSSYRATAGLVPSPPWLTTRWVLAQFGRRPAAARAAWAAFVAEGAAPVWDQLRGQIYLGSEAWVERMKRGLPTGGHLAEVPRPQRMPEPPALGAICAVHPDRRAAMRAAWATGGYTLRAITAHFGVHQSTVSRAVGRRLGAAMTLDDKE